MATTRLGVSLKYTDRIYKVGTDDFEYFHEEQAQPTMNYPKEEVMEAHEQWLKASARVNARTHQQKLLLESKQTSKTKSATADLKFEDIEEFFNKNGGGPRFLEIEYTPDIAGPQDYETKNKIKSKYWFWTHKLTKRKAKRFLNPSGNSYESGILTKNLRAIDMVKFPVAYARAQIFLSLNKSNQDILDDSVPTATMDRSSKLRQQVSYNRLSSFVYLNVHSPLTLFMFLHTGQGSTIYH